MAQSDRSRNRRTMKASLESPAREKISEFAPFNRRCADNVPRSK
jgi:hypothetical protein